MYRALVIGCGNIGAGYDLDNEHILTHAKAYHLHPDFELTIYDTKLSVAETVSKKYNCAIADNISKNTLGTFDCVSICTPTNAHFTILNDAVSVGVKLIVCEKPVSYNSQELENMESVYTNGNSKIIVNYIRRFQPAYKEMKAYVSSLLDTEKVTNVSIRYQKGFINNCSHAFDLIEYLCGRNIELADIRKYNAVNDYFDNDPTVSLQAKWGEANFDVLGLTKVYFSHFEIDIFFEWHKISISEAGNIVNVYVAEKDKKNPQALKKLNEYSKQGCIQDYMKYVINEAHSSLKNGLPDDNFLNSVKLNQTMLNYLSL